MTWPLLISPCHRSEVTGEHPSFLFGKRLKLSTAKECESGRREEPQHPRTMHRLRRTTKVGVESSSFPSLLRCPATENPIRKCGVSKHHRSDDDCADEYKRLAGRGWRSIPERNTEC